MSDVTTAADSGTAEPAIPVAPAPAGPAITGSSPVTAREAARSLTTWRHKQREQRTDDGGQRTEQQARDPSSKPAPAEAGGRSPSSDKESTDPRITSGEAGDAAPPTG